MHKYSRNLSHDSFLSYILSKLLSVLLKSNNDQILSYVNLFIDYALSIMKDSNDEKTLDNIMTYTLNYVKMNSSNENLEKIPYYVTNLMIRNNHFIITVNI